MHRPVHNEKQPAPAGVSEQGTQTSVEMVSGKNRHRDYFRNLRRRLKIGFILAFFIPLALLSAYFHFQFNITMKESGQSLLKTLAESQRITFDLFLQERLVNLFHLLHASEMQLPPTAEEMNRLLQHLRESSDAFVDVGFLNPSGKQIGYAGPYPALRGRDYSGEEWFQTLKTQERDYHITDIYLGFRNKPHFTVAVRFSARDDAGVIRATLDPDKLYMFLRTLSLGEGVESGLVNLEGKYQLVDPGMGKLLEKAAFIPPRFERSGSREVTDGRDTHLVAYAWLEEVPWVLIVRQPLRVAYAKMYQARRIMVLGTVILLMVISAVVWITTERLLRRAEATEEARASLKSQLIHAGKLASIGELAAGIAHEINNPLAIVSSESGLIRDMLDPRFGMDATPEKIREELGHIDEAVQRATNITKKLLSFSRKEQSRFVPSNLNHVLDEVVGGLKEEELRVADVEVVRDYDPSLPALLVDPDPLRQVFLNLINNAQDAIQGSGQITLSTRHDDETVRVTVRDTGKGMTAEQMERIFLPFYTTKEVGKGTGLGLSISSSLVESMGGRIEVQSLPGAGSSFTVVLPSTKQGEGASNGGIGESERK
jgi:two-component system NtrC family sensor kinase